MTTWWHCFYTLIKSWQHVNETCLKQEDQTFDRCSDVGRRTETWVDLNSGWDPEKIHFIWLRNHMWHHWNNFHWVTQFTILITSAPNIQVHTPRFFPFHYCPSVIAMTFKDVLTWLGQHGLQDLSRHLALLRVTRCTWYHGTYSRTVTWGRMAS